MEQEQTAFTSRPQSTALDIDLAGVSEGLSKIRAFQALVQRQMVAEHDYGIIPGTQKPTLLKPGAEKIAKLLGLADAYEVADKVEDWDKGFFTYTVRCKLTSMQSGCLVSEGIGNCNSKESRYAYRWCFSSEVPADVDTRACKTKEIRTKRGPATMYRVPNEDIFSQVNTILKMAKKRALVDAALSAGRLSDLFTQDMEDLQPPRKTAAEPLNDGRDAMLEQIKAHLIAKFPGEDDAAKAAKGEELHAVFGQRSWRAVTSLPLDVLTKGLGALQAAQPETANQGADDDFVF